MKKLFTGFSILLILVGAEISKAQAFTDSWSLGAGLRTAHMASSNATISNDLFGSTGFSFILQKFFDEQVALRLTSHYTTTLHDHPTGGAELTSTALGADYSIVYRFVPCGSVRPHVNLGVGYDLYSFSTDNNKFNTEDQQSFYYVGGAGVEWKIWETLGLLTQFQYFQLTIDEFDGISGTEGYGILGTNEDSYFTFDATWIWYFSTGDESAICGPMYGGVRQAEMPDPVDYDRIEQIVKDNVPREVVKEVVVEKPVYKDGAPSQGDVGSASSDQWVLVGINFPQNGTSLQPEAYPVLLHSVQVLLRNPNMTVEIEGHTDSMGPDDYNKNLSLDRAKTVKNYLVARGINANRLKTVGYGSSKPIASNRTAEGRAMNRRIEFKILSR